MVYAGVASLSQTIDLVLNYHRDSISPKLKNQMISLQEHTLFLESYLEEFPHRVDFWEEEIIRESTDMAENIIELLLSDSLLESKSSVGSSNPKSVKGKKYQLPYGFIELERVTHEIDSIVNRLKGIHTEAMDGLDDELMTIISLLRGDSSDLEIIGIYGMEGMGKSTLARNVYNNPLIVEHFAVRAWSTVLEEYGLPQIASDLLRSMKVEESISNSEPELIKSLRKNLDGRRYLIVLDDARSLQDLRWLQKKLPANGNGSRIMLTTTSFRFLKSVDHLHKMGFINEDSIWNRLREKIFEGDSCPPQLESIGKMILRRCRGNYLAFEVVSGMLAAADKTEAAWEDISENMKIASEDVGRELVQILYLSYTYLPHHLRACFLYLGIFPKYHDIRVSKLIKLWVAEGFLNESEYKSFEETGEGYVEDLVRRNLVWVWQRKSNGRIKSIGIDDMREFCLRQARIDNFFLDVSRFDSFDRQELQSCHRVSSCIYDDDFLEGVYGSTIRTIMLFLKNSELGSSIRWSIGNVRLLRILDLSNASNCDLAEEVFDMFHLRYLAFHSGFSISEAISNLENLQTLIICPRENDGGMFDNLPEGIWRMPQLRHLNLYLFPFKLPSPKGMTTSALENLQTLSRVVDFICSGENLQMIPNLKKLALLYTKNSRDAVEDFDLHNLIYLQKLEILKIEMNWSLREEHKMNFAFPPTLKKLKLCGVQLPWEDMKIVASLPNLQVLKLRNHACIGETWETSEGGFSQLTYLLIEESDLMNWITGSSHFPSLESLVLYGCSRLLQVPSDIGKIPTLALIELDEQNHSLLCSAKQIRKDLQSSGESS